jgi:glutathione S-transferase
MPPSKRTKTVQFKLTYWPIQGRAEQIRLALVLAGQGWEEFPVKDEDYGTKPNAGTALQPFGQWPILDAGEDGVIVQADAILRYVGRKFLKQANLTMPQNIILDQILIGSYSLRNKYSDLIWRDNCSQESLDKFLQVHVDPTSIRGKNDGAHVGYINGFFERNKVGESGSSPWIALTKTPTIADVVVFNVMDYIRRLAPEKFDAWYPRLVAHRQAFLSIPEIKEYVDTKQFKHVNDDNGVGDGVTSTTTTTTTSSSSSSNNNTSGTTTTTDGGETVSA